MAASRRIRRSAPTIAFVVAGTALQLIRQPGLRSWDTVWAEDGFVYATEALARPAWKTLLAGYAGYAQFVPRVLALPLRVVPVGAWAAYLAVVSALVTSLLALCVVRWSRGWVGSTLLRWTLAVTMIVLPASYFEIQTNLANLGWPLVVASFWAIASRRDTTRDVALRVTVIVLAALSTPVQAVLVPWAAVVVLVRRRRSDWITLAALSAGLVVQVLAIGATTQGDQVPSTAGELPRELAVRVLGSMWIGERWLADAWIDHGAALVVAVTLVTVVVVALGWRQPIPTDRRWLVAGAIATSLLAFVFSVWVRGTALLWMPTGRFTSAGSRYVYVPIVLLLSGLVVLADSARRRWVRSLLVAQTVFVVATSFALTSPRSIGPSWTGGVDAARVACEHLPPGATVEVPISLGDPAEVPCSRL
jgi:hypothetical protein